MTTDTSSDAAGEPPRRSGRSSRPPDPARTSGSSSTSSTEIGRVGRSHGLDGSFYVTRPEQGILAIGLQTSVGEVERLAGTAAKPLVHVAGVTTREAAEALRGEPILVSRDVVGLEEGEWWADDLVGLAVVDGDRAVGVVERVRALPSCEVLVVGDLLIPLIDDAVRDVDVEGGRIDVDLGFLGER